MKHKRSSLYLDEDTNNKLSDLAKNLHRSKNGLICFLINDYFDRGISKKDIIKKIKPVKGSKIKTNFDRENIYNDLS